MERPIQLGASRSLRRQRLAQLLTQRGLAAGDPSLLRVVKQAQLSGSIALSSPSVRPDSASAAGTESPTVDVAPAARLSRAQEAVDPKAPFSVAAVKTWHQAVTESQGYRTSERSRHSAPPPAPPPFIAERMASLEEWMRSPGCAELTPVRAAALAMARIVEILPFEDGNGRVSRLAASHILVAGGADPPILGAQDGPRLIEALGAAFRLDMEPLAGLLELASERSLEVMIETLARAG